MIEECKMDYLDGGKKTPKTPPKQNKNNSLTFILIIQLNYTADIFAIWQLVDFYAGAEAQG